MATLKYLFAKMDIYHSSFSKNSPAGVYLFKDNNGNTKAICEICSKLTIKTSEQRHSVIISLWHPYFLTIENLWGSSPKIFVSLEVTTACRFFSNVIVKIP